MGIGIIGWLVAIGCLLLGVAASVWGLTELPKFVPIWLIGFPGAVSLIIAAGLELQRLSEKPIPPTVIDQTSRVEDIPLVLPVDIGIIRIKLPSGVTAGPHVQFRVRNYGKANAILRRVQ